RPVRWTTADQHTATLATSLLDKCGDDFELPAILYGSKIRAFCQAVADDHLSAVGGQFTTHLIIKAVMDIESLQRGACLAVVDECTPEEPLDDLLRIRVRQHDSGVVAAEFERQALQRVGGILHDPAAGCG